MTTSVEQGIVEEIKFWRLGNKSVFLQNFRHDKASPSGSCNNWDVKKMTPMTYQA